ncbi:MAG: NDP-sugar synthase [Candidatus Aenigmarchaeota archaeon]|nr:NDP-sugar synthase [Candidatus Aenigmarchaeota archaeon]
MNYKFAQSVIIAGGKGTRLGKFSDYQPKHILPVLNSPLIDYHIESLIERYAPIRFSYSTSNKDFFDNYFLKFKELFEQNLLQPKTDTVMKGPIYPLIELLYDLETNDDFEDCIIGITGDMFGDIDIEEVREFHEKQGRHITLVATRTYPTSKACVFDVNDDNSLRGFRRLDSISTENDLINLGLYVAGPGLLKIIGTDLESYKEDFIFDILAQEGALTVYVNDEKAVNINTPYNLLCANMGALKRLCKKHFQEACIDKENVVLYGTGTQTDQDAIIRNSVLGNYVIINKRVKMKNVVVMDGCEIGRESELNNVILGKNSTVQPESKLENCVVHSDGSIKSMEIYYEFE